jgi:hypothetical protein
LGVFWKRVFWKSKAEGQRAKKSSKKKVFSRYHIGLFRGPQKSRKLFDFFGPEKKSIKKSKKSISQEIQ